MSIDIFGCRVSLESEGSVASWNSTMLGILSHASSTPTHLADVLDEHPDFALGHIIKGLFYLLLGRSELTLQARESLLFSQSLSSQGSLCIREQAFLSCLRSWCDGSPSLSISYLDEYLLHHPGDALAVKMGYSIRFILGDISGMRESIERVLPAYADDHPARGYILGCHSFSLEETGDYQLSESAGRQGLELAPDDAWGLHAVTHVYDMTANAKSGIEFLSGRESAWSHCNNFRYHVWWHKALMHLDLGDIESVLHLYDAKIRSDKTDDYRDISNATSLLSRLELHGVDVADRWEELADISSSRTQDGCFIFADLHYLLALLGAKREDAATTLLSRISQDAKRSSTESEQRMANPGYSAACGLQAFSQGDYALAYKHLSSARQNMQLIGGSHAQRDIFERLTIDSSIRSGNLDSALNLLSDRRKNRGGNEDGYTASRLALISRARTSESIPAE